ncbi:hypothetical protein FSP39_000209 [Pinctada imbricata]|uniref:Uncharacterized protein n=1 Tax=Pinctada imbricata TaxID=66713 RepID=A0AA88YRY6_PINIB|nr:hypothetical protein FSP39_000209 [Pinctada imbricata]
MGILIGSAVIPIGLCMCWEKLSGNGMVAGSISGTVFALITWLVVASTNEGGLTASNFFQNTGQENAMLAGNLVAILTGGVITIFYSLVTSCSASTLNSADVWENTRDIDNPLSPWTELYAK